MARHRNVRNRNYSDEYDYDDVYGHSVEEDSCMSPSDAEQWMYDRSRDQPAISNFLDSRNDIQEETEEQTAAAHQSLKRRESVDLRGLNLKEDDEAKLMSCLDELQNVLGDTIPETILVHSVLKHNFNCEKALEEILNNKTPKDKTEPAVALTPVTIEPAKAPEITPVDSPKVISTNNEPNKAAIIKGFTIGDESSKSCPQTSRDQSPANKDRTLSKADQVDENKVKDTKPDPNTQYAIERGSDKEDLYIIVIGHVDAGKSTLIGRLLWELGEVSQRTLHKYEQESKKIGKQSFMYAWVLDETGEERVRGITMDVGKAQFETKSKKVIILDAPGHADFIPNMITGAGQADVALLVVDATRGEFESGFDLGGQTREHALLVRSLGVSQIAVAINKLDTSNWSEERFVEINIKLKYFLKAAGFQNSDVVFVPCSGLTGENLIKTPTEAEFLKWYTGPSLLDVIDNFKVPERPVSKPLCMSISDIFKGTGSGFCVAGRIINGMLTKGDKVVVCPSKEMAEVKSLSINDISSNIAFAGDQVTVTLSGIEMQNVGLGFMLCDPVQPIPISTRFEARALIFNLKVPITIGFPVFIHHLSLAESANITKLKVVLEKTTDKVLKMNPRCLKNNCVAVFEMQVPRPICIERYKDDKKLGRIVLRVGGVTIAVGFVTNVYTT